MIQCEYAKYQRLIGCKEWLVVKIVYVHCGL